MGVDLSTQTTDPEMMYWPINRNELVEIGEVPWINYLLLGVRFGQKTM